MSEGATDIDAYNALRPVRFALLVTLTIQQSVGQQFASELSLTLTLTPDAASQEKLVLTFVGVRDLAIDWPNWSLVRVDVIDIIDIRDRGLEDIQYRVAEGSGMLAFSCRTFHASVD